MMSVTISTRGFDSGTDSIARQIASASEADAKWDLLLGSVAAYILTSVGRIHQLFPVLEILHPAIVAGLLAIALYLFDGGRHRQLGLLWVDTTKWLIALFVWMLLSLTSALVLS